jgi:hypothetical protein
MENKDNLYEQTIQKVAEQQTFKIEQHLKLFINPKPRYIPNILRKKLVRLIVAMKIYK